ncbi:hypothetical protein FACS1894152_1560 [Bacilli bacterium]|nr:hypothetical protein FACS1894152_1560 [Bacilli bacterium]
MSLNGSDLASSVLTGLGGINNYSDGITAYTEAIKDYVESNIEVTGTYSGNLANGNSDPLNGDYKLIFTMSPTFTGANNIKSFLSGLTEANPSGFIGAIVQDVTNSTVSMASPIVMSVPIAPLQPGSVDANSLANCTNAGDCWKVVGQAIVNSFLTLTFQDTPTVSTSGGTGTTKFKEVK